MKDGSNVKRLPLQRTDPEFQRIEQRFLTELINGKYANSPGHKYDKSKTKVETIDKIQYKALCRQYLTKKKCLEESNPNRPANMPRKGNCGTELIKMQWTASSCMGSKGVTLGIIIDKIQYKALCRQYLTKKKCLEESNPNRPANMPLERELWHGTNQNAMDSIILHGFKRSYAWDNIGKPWWGQGVYFAPDASYSARSWMTEADCYGSKGYVLLVKVLTGQFLKGNPYMRYLPPIDKNNPLVLYDCAVDEEPHGVCHL
ncbi:hypothetical protein DPMN_000370 [Dreissena polymorpha]|uniref:Poly [ADP-ribose] polymerase n=1 Tax=Dreissena polymorpha TaxID=45954 RepID=A0A9D4RRZ1_DREPO|nr:hypothetical protein DPMN_000370 [Dreissena polymorpha]